MGICRREFGACLLGGMLAGGVRAAAPRPKLLIVLVLQEFRPDYLDLARSPSAAGGLRRVLEKGAVFYDCRHEASTFPSTSLATLATGAWPSQHGIVADYWYDRALRRPVRASEEDLLATTLGAQIAAEPQRSITVVSLDETHAALFAGSLDARLYWMNAEGQFATRGDAPEWLAPYNAQIHIDQFRNVPWQAVGARPDAPALRTLRFDEKRPQEFDTLFRGSPFALRSQFEFVQELIGRERLGKGTSTDLLCVLAGSTAVLGYETGARSPLMDQLVLQFDQRLAGLLDQLSKVPGDGAFGLVLMGAHGAPPDPPAEFRDTMAVSGQKVADAIERALAEQGSGHVEKYLYPFLYLDTTGFRDPDPIRLSAARAALQYPAVAGYYTAAGACSTASDWARRFRNSFHPKRSGDVMLSYRPEQVEDYGQGRGVSYGSLYNYDAQVPLCLYGPQFRTGAFTRPVEAIDLAPTLARVLDVSLPSSATGRVLEEALAE